MSKRILVTGANGQLGQCLQELALKYTALDFVFVSRSILDITDEEQVKSFFQFNKFDAVINTAAYTAVDLAESDKENARLVNAWATKYLAEATVKQNIPLIHISTDYVFDGTSKKPCLETDEVHPMNIYGQTKLEGEEFALGINPKTIVIRTSWLYSKYGHNFVKTMLRLFNEKTELNVVHDQIGSPTNALDLAEALIQILLQDQLVYGVFNYSNEGQCSWFEFAMKIKELSNSEVIINPVPTTAFPTAAIRPQYSLLDKTKIKKSYHLDILNWEVSLKNMLYLYLK